MKSYHRGLTFSGDSREYFLNVVRRALDLKCADPVSQLCQVRKLGCAGVRPQPTHAQWIATYSFLHLQQGQSH